MVLAIDIGNTNVVIGVIDEEDGVRKTLFSSRLSTARHKTSDQHAIEIKDILNLYEIDTLALEGAIIASVVPSLSEAYQRAVERLTRKKPMMVGPGIKTGLDIKIDNPAQLGSDLVVAAAAAISKYPTPLCVFDLGTATTITVVDNKNQVLGCLIVPGVRISIDALTSRTSQLQDISLDMPKNVIGTNTIDSMKSGLILGNAVMFDGLISRIEAELQKKVTAVATGGLASHIVPHCKREIIVDDDLMMDGLYNLYRKNTGHKTKNAQS